MLRVFSFLLILSSLTLLSACDRPPTPTNEAPTAQIEVNREDDPLFAFDARTSSDPDGTIVGYNWDFGDDETGSGETVTHQYELSGDEAETFEVVLTVTDDDGATGTTSTAVTVAPAASNEPPIARIEVSPEDNVRFTFEASTSSDPDGTIVGYNWDFGDDETGSGETVTHQYELSGDEAETFEVVLTVTDDDGATGTTSTTVTVEPAVANEAPIAQIEVSQDDNVRFTFDARTSSDPDGTIVGYDWDFGDDETGSGETVTHQYELGGDEAETFEVVLTVTDDDGATGTASTTVTVEPAASNEPPIARIEVSQEDNVRFTFEASTSNDPDGTIIGYDWDFGDDETGSGETVTHRYELSGDEAETFEVVLTVTDDDGATGTARTIVTVEPPEPTVLRGLVEVTIQGDGGATFVPVDGGQGLQLEPLNNGLFDTAGVSYDDCDNSRGTRFLFASYRVRNATTDGTPYDVDRRNITFLAVDNNGSDLGVNALGDLRKFDGSSFVDPASVADCLKPTHRVRFDPIDGVTTVDSGADMQAFAETDIPTADTLASDLSTPALSTTFPYGFVVRTPDGSRTLPADPAPDQFDGVITFAVRHPRQETRADEPFTIRLWFYVFEDNDTRVTEGLAEQGDSGVTDRAALIGSDTEVTLLGDSTTPITDFSVSQLRTVRNAGTPDNPTRYLVNAEATSPSCEVSADLDCLNTNPDEATTEADVPVTLDVLANDRWDGATIDPARVALVTTDPANGTVTVNDDATLTYSPDPGYADATDRFDYILSYAADDATVTAPPTLVSVLVTPADAEPNEPPQAAFTLSPERGPSETVFSFDASASDDPDGSIVRYDWDFGDGTTGEGVSAEHRFVHENDTNQTFTVTLRVTDDAGDVGSSSQSLTVTPAEAPPNQAPTATFTVTPESGTAATVFDFDASASDDPDGSVAGYDWDFGDGTSGSGVTTTHQYSLGSPDTTTFDITLIITDDDGERATATRSVTVEAEPEENQPPQAQLEVTRQSDRSFSFGAGASVDPDGSVVGYDWDFGDGNAGSGAQVSHQYLEAELNVERYTVTLIVTDDDGATDTAEVDVDVAPPFETIQLGSPHSDTAFALTSDTEGSVYVAGHTFGTLSGDTNVGGSDLVVVKIDARGEQRWTQQLGTPQNDLALGLASGGDALYLVGTTHGDLGTTNAGLTDLFVMALDKSGTVRWVRQTGTPSFDYATGVAVDRDGNLYVSGYTHGRLGTQHMGRSDLVIIKFDRDGTELWTRQLGTPQDDHAVDIATAADGSVYVVGTSYGDFAEPHRGGGDWIVVKLDRDGREQWRRQGDSNRRDRVTSIATDLAGNVYIAGSTPGRARDLLSASLSAEGELRWQQTSGSNRNDLGADLATDDRYLYLVGTTDSASGFGQEDGFLSVYTFDRIGQDNLRFGSSQDDRAAAVTVRDGSIYTATNTLGSLSASDNTGQQDFVLRRDRRDTFE